MKNDMLEQMRAALDERAVLRIENRELKAEIARLKLELEKVPTDSGLFVDEISELKEIDDRDFWTSQKNHSICSSSLSAEVRSPRRKVLEDVKRALRSQLRDGLVDYACSIVDKVGRDE
jgi:hypothetical protein